MVHSYLCDNSSNPLWLSAACATGTVDMLLHWISPEKVAQQVGCNDGNVFIVNRALHLKSKSGVFSCVQSLPCCLDPSHALLSLLLIFILKCHLHK